jgi:hypothetical protein
MPTFNYVHCTCCGNQFTDRLGLLRGIDALHFVCTLCDDERRVENADAHSRWLDEMEAQCGWFSAADER